MSSIANKSLYEIPIETGIVQLICAQAFGGLSLQEKKYATFIAGASWKGALTCLFQTSPESPYIFAMLRYAFDFAFDSKELFSEAVSECSDEFKASVMEKLSDASLTTK